MDYRDSVHRDPIQRDPVYDAIGGPMRKHSAVEGYGSGPLWGWTFGFILTAAVLLIAYNGSGMRIAQHEVLVFPLPTRITPAPSLAPAPLVPAPAIPGALPPSPAR
jgi:hypothetical protein